LIIFYIWRKSNFFDCGKYRIVFYLIFYFKINWLMVSKSRTYPRRLKIIFCEKENKIFPFIFLYFGCRGDIDFISERFRNWYFYIISGNSFKSLYFWYIYIPYFSWFDGNAFRFIVKWYCILSSFSDSIVFYSYRYHCFPVFFLYFGVYFLSIGLGWHIIYLQLFCGKRISGRYHIVLNICDSCFVYYISFSIFGDVVF